MSSVFTSKKVMVIVVVLILLFLKVDAFAGEDWKLITEIPTKRAAFATAVVDDKIYLIGGTRFENFKRGPYGLSTVEAYDPQTNTWERLANMPTPREAPKAAVVNGIIYVFGGWHQQKGREIKFPVEVEAYDPATDTWTRKRGMPVSRLYFGLGVVDEKVYIIGGTTGWRDDDEERIDRVDIYNSGTNMWVKGPPKMPTRREPSGAGVVGNRIYVIGGTGWPRVDNTPGPYLTVIEEYDPISRQWQKKSDMLHSRGSCATVVVRDEVYLIGGFTWEAGGFKQLATVDVYNPQRESWRESPALPTALFPAGAATVNGNIYVFGGLEFGGNREYSPDVVAFDTGFRAVTAKGKLSTRWSELKAEH